jgi:hypothetical protein
MVAPTESAQDRPVPLEGRELGGEGRLGGAGLGAFLFFDADG